MTKLQGPKHTGRTYLAPAVSVFGNWRLEIVWVLVLRVWCFRRRRSGPRVHSRRGERGGAVGTAARADNLVDLVCRLLLEKKKRFRDLMHNLDNSNKKV